jgi:hypothetical protein
MPDHEQPRPYWQYQIEVLDDLVLDWDMPYAPVVIDARPLVAAEALFAALEGRDLPYVAQVGPSLTVGYRASRLRTPLAHARGGYWRGAILDLVLGTNGARRQTASWPDGTGDRVRRAQFLQLPVWPAEPDGTVSRLRPAARQLIAEWPLARPRPRGYWITNITNLALSDLVALAKLPGQVGARVEDFAVRFGLRDYEGRTFAGWHHHVTLASAAQVFRVLTAPSPDGEPGHGQATEVRAWR